MAFRHAWVGLFERDGESQCEYIHARFQSCARTGLDLGFNSALVVLHPFAAFTCLAFMHVEFENM
jgi:hypothetical protein